MNIRLNNITEEFYTKNKMVVDEIFKYYNTPEPVDIYTNVCITPDKITIDDIAPLLYFELHDIELAAKIGPHLLYIRTDEDDIVQVFVVHIWAVKLLKPQIFEIRYFVDTIVYICYKNSIQYYINCIKKIDHNGSTVLFGVKPSLFTKIYRSVQEGKK